MKNYAIGVISLFMMMFALLSITRVEGVEPELLKKYVADSQAATNSWLALVDQGKYGESWDAASKTMQWTIKRDEWIKNLDGVRKPLGAVKSREILDVRTATNPQGLPQGEYMIFVYNTSFANKDKAYELVTLIQENDGSWRVLTYQVT